MCDGVAAYRTSLCQSPAIWSRIRAISSPGTTTNTGDKSKRRRFVGLIYKLTKFAARACRPEAEQWSHKADKLTARSVNAQAAEVSHTTRKPGARTQRRPPQITRYIGQNALVMIRPLTTSRTVSLGWRAHATAPQTGCAPSGTFHLIGSFQPVREDSTRSEGVESSRSGVTPHPSQASSRSRPTMTHPVLAGDALSTINCA